MNRGTSPQTHSRSVLQGVRGTLLACVAGCTAILGAVPARSENSPATRMFDLEWTIQVEKVPPSSREARVWISVPQELPEQKVSGLSVKTDRPWKLVQDATFGNQVVLVTVPTPPASFSIDLAAHVQRAAIDAPHPAKLDKKERSLYEREEALVRISPRVRSLADSIPDTDRARYDYVLAAMDYDKTVPGWGRGDVARACAVGKGNCTDFHSLFMALSRARGVPVVFEMGYPTVVSGEARRAGGYHCWAWFYDDDEKAWIPVDISEADKHPDQREYFFGHLDADRITFSRGRDVVLPGMKGLPLNYLPASAYVEVDGKPLEDGVTRLLSYSVDGKAAGN